MADGSSSERQLGHDRKARFALFDVLGMPVSEINIHAGNAQPRIDNLSVAETRQKLSLNLEEAFRRMLDGYSKLCHRHQLSLQLPSSATCLLKARGRSRFSTTAAVKVPARLAKRHAVKQKQRAAEWEAAAALAAQKQNSDNQSKQKLGHKGAAQKKGKQKSQRTAQACSALFSACLGRRSLFS